jgi:hypothetical protein
VVLGDADAVAEASFPLVTAFGIDPGEEDHCGGLGGKGERGELLTIANLAEGGTDSLFGLSGESFSFALLTFEALHRGEESRRLRLAK